MSLYPWKDHENSHLGKVPCVKERDTWVCPNMLPVEGDMDMSYEHYYCKKCGKGISLDYDEMR